MVITDKIVCFWSCERDNDYRDGNTKRRFGHKRVERLAHLFFLCAFGERGNGAKGCYRAELGSW